MSFQDQLVIGQIGESKIARWLRNRGSYVMPVYEKEIDNGKGPRLFCPEGQLVTPDLFAFPSMEFIEAKHKSVFSWHHKTGTWLTGIDLNHYGDYQKVQEQTGRRVWLFFLHRSSTPSQIDLRGRGGCYKCSNSSSGSCCPTECPTGLFGGSISHLAANEHHQHSNHGRHGMAYWSVDTLTRHASVEELDSQTETPPPGRR